MVAVPEIDLSEMEPRVEASFRAAREALLADSRSAENWGTLGRVAHAHELWTEASFAYRQAERLDPTDARWPYFLGDVESVVGSDLDVSVGAFRRAMKLKPDYPPAHMRLGRVLFAAGRVEEAAAELERGLELEPALQPARVTLAQIELGRGDLAASEALLDTILADEPRHAQALAALGQVLMRTGRRDQAREIAARARQAAIYNLFSDPLMSEVVAEGVSSVLIWERAKAFF